MMHSLKHKQQRGSVLITFTVCLVALVGFVGLALDSGSGYLAKSKLSSAVDGAALAGGHAVVHGGSWAEQKTNAEAAARTYFATNYPNGTFGTTPTLESVTVSKSFGRISVAVTASAKGQVSFMRLLGFDQQIVRASAVVGSASVDLALVVDGSESIGTEEYKKLQASNIALVDTYLSPEMDRLAVVLFSSKSRVALAPRSSDVGYDPQAAHDAINTPYSRPGGTNTPAGLDDAIQQLLHTITNPSVQQIIMLATDGVPQYGGDGGRAPQNTQDKADEARDEGIAVLVVGYGLALDSAIQGPDVVDYLKCVANAPDADPLCRQPTKPQGAYCYSKDASGLQICYDKLMTQALKLTR